MLIREIAQYLDDRGLGIFDERGVTGTIFLERLPEGNATAEVVTAIVNTGGYAPNPRLHLDRPSVQILVRGGAVPTNAWLRALAIYNCLQSFNTDRFTPVGTWIVDCQAVAQPGNSYRDDSGRVVYPLNFILQTVNHDSEWRPANG